MQKLKVLDIFSGIGGFSLGLHDVGCFETAAFCEIDRDAQLVLEKNFPGTTIFNDVSKLNLEELRKHNLEKIDIICGGFPCQDISVAGHQKGLVDTHGKNTRSGLWFEYKRLIEEIRPRWVIIENVANLRSNGLATVLQDLHEIGYDAEGDIISARAIGSCHLRERIWIVAYPNGEQLRIESGRGIGTSGSDQRVIGNDGEKGNSSTAYSESIRLQGVRASGIEVSTSLGEKISTGGSAEGNESSDSSGERREGCLRIEGDSREVGGEQTSSSSNLGVCEKSSNSMSTPVTYADDFRFWPAFTSEETKSEWWAERTFSERDWWKIESAICRMDDAVSGRLDETEKRRRARIKQLGNSIVPGIVRIIGNRIKYHEFDAEGAL